MKFGYLPSLPNALLSADAKDLAIRKFQKSYGLPITGHIDERTVSAMNEPRCSLPDFDNGVGRWSRHLHPQHVEETLRRALDVWEKEADVKFVKEQNPIISVNFGVRDHSCPFLFDPTVLAHAFMPTDPITDLTGDVHFNDEFTWTTSEYRISLLSVATHEIGHAIGLTHNMDEADSIMSPRDQHRKTRITERDRYYLLALYGRAKGSPEVDTARPTYSPGTERERNHYHTDTIKPNPCTSKIDGIGTMRGNFFVFKDEWMWVFAYDGTLFREPELIATAIPNMPYPVDSVLEVDDDLWCFIGTEVYVIHMTQQGLRVKHAPYRLADFGIDSSVKHIDVAYEWFYEPYRWCYIWSGSQYWKIDIRARRVEATYPREINKGWRSVPLRSSAGFTYDGELHFIQEGMVYRMNSSDFRLPVATGYPIPTSNFFKSCPKSKANYISNASLRFFNFKMILIEVFLVILIITGF
ncbi:unnamed protein product [Auanema sp. JU1783]|nr:unnamed protein product [Auanema sp. JU1783]